MRDALQSAMLTRLRLLSTVLLLGLAVAFGVPPARAADTGNGSKNFSAPQSVPNYFSNEAGPMQGPTSETQRGPLYMGQTYGSLQQPGARTAVIEASRYRQHVAFAAPRGRLVRGRPVVAHHIIVHGRPVYRIVTRGSLHAHTSYVARGATTHASHTTTRVSSSHRHARG
jgi:hypothetical protein